MVTILASFALSGLLHTAAGVASGMPVDQLGVFRFFGTQAIGLVFEQGVAGLLRKGQRHDGRIDEDEGKPAWYGRISGYVWVVAFLVWTGPSWIYPQAARAPAEGATDFLPFSLIKWLRN
jgi:hypothetical protein